MIAISMRLNFLFGAALGQTAEKSLVFGLVSVGADAWKGLGPIFIFALWRSRKRSPAAAATVVWIPCFLFSITSALGLAIQDRASAIGGRETVQANYEDVRTEIEDVETRRRALPSHRSAGEIDAAINALLSQPVASAHRIRGTVGSLSAGCTKADVRTTETCAEIARLRKELATAIEGARLEERMSELRRRAETLRERGAGQLPDPQAELLSGLTRGWLAVRDVGPSLALLLAAVIELVSAFGPVVLAAYAEASRDSGHQREAEASAIDYMLERMEPAEKESVISADALYADYRSWCAAKRREAVASSSFIQEFDRSRIEHGLANIQKFGNRYYGIKFAAR